MHEIGPQEDIDTNNLYKHTYHLGTPNKLKSMIYQMNKIHEKMKSSMNDSCLQVDGHGSYEYFSSCMK